MIGRHKDVSIYKEIFTSSEFLRILFSAILIISAVIIKRTEILTNVYISLFSQKLSLHSFLYTSILLLSTGLNAFGIIFEAAKGLFQKQLNVDELVSIAIIACILTGNYFEAAIVSIIMIAGAFLEEAVSNRARHSIEGLIKLNPETALVEENGRTKEKNISTINIGDTVIVKAGEIVPIDGVVIQGTSSIDESLLTGEAIPVVKKNEDAVSAGTQNLAGLLKIQVSRKGEDSTISRLIELVQNAENSNIEGTRIVDTFAVYFTPTILLIAILTYLTTRDITRAITVLVVGCPCSFLLTGPVSTVATIARAARSGIIVKGGNYLEKIATCRALLLDKTGTITEGKPVVTKIETFGEHSEKELLSYAAALEEGSTHPLADAITSKADKAGISKKEASSIQVQPGLGIEGTVDNKYIKLTGSSHHTENGESLINITIDNEIGGIIHCYDKLKDEIPKTIERIKKLGITDITILSGDSETAVKRTAKEAGITNYFSRMRPEDKMKHIDSLQSSPVVFIGDGMNDAPSLKIADAGISMGERGSQIALESSDIVLLNDSITLLPFLIHLSRKMSIIIKINIAISLLINLVAIILSYYGILNPVMGALTHNAGSLFVVFLSASITFTGDKNA